MDLYKASETLYLDIFLINRKQGVNITCQDVLCVVQYITEVVPQGSLMGSIVIYIYINDLQKLPNLKLNLIIFLSLVSDMDYNITTKYDQVYGNQKKMHVHVNYYYYYY